MPSGKECYCEKHEAGCQDRDCCWRGDGQCVAILNQEVVTEKTDLNKDPVELGNDAKRT